MAHPHAVISLTRGPRLEPLAQEHGLEVPPRAVLVARIRGKGKREERRERGVDGGEHAHGRVRRHEEE
jgi:hypothetical protein